MNLPCQSQGQQCCQPQSHQAGKEPVLMRPNIVLGPIMCQRGPRGHLSFLKPFFEVKTISMKEMKILPLQEVLLSFGEAAAWDIP